MVTLHRQDNWKIAIYGADHGVPHFHIEGPDFRCSVGIQSGDVIVGSVSRQVLAAARQWATANKASLAAKWKELNG
jgi:hypothetical protein